MPHIQVAGVVRGPGHVRSGQPCEDSFASHRVGDWTSAVVCDGCGGARHAREGAQLISEYLSNRLASIAPELTNRCPGDWLIDAIVSMVTD
jgi:serine/threonine protein phosphatase PrpC